MRKIRGKPFKDWLYEDINDAFGYNRKFDHPLFDQFATMTISNTHPLRQAVEDLRRLAFEYIDSWNEDEYKFMFISPLIALVKFISPNYKVFTQRPMSLKYDNDTKITEGVVEFMLATGLQNPKRPHFFLHEYKPEKRRDNDPLGQLLIAMITSQTINQDEKPVYGIYVNGRNWFFVILENKTYYTSNPYVVSSDDIFDLYAILEFFKQKMEDLYKKI
jgi:hypothetical protein